MINNDLYIEIKKIPKETKFLAEKFALKSFVIPKSKKGYGISICYANNGVGKTTICNSILSNLKFVNKKIEIFSYEKNMFIDTSNHFIVAENIAVHEKRKSEIYDCYVTLSATISFLFENFECYPRTNLYKQGISLCFPFGLDLTKYKFNKNDSKKKIFSFDYSDIKKFSKNINLNKGKICSNIDIKASSINFEKCLHQYVLFNQIPQNLKILIFKKLKNFLNKISINIDSLRNDLSEIKKINKLISTNNIDLIGEIYEIINGLKILKKCLICEREIVNFTEIKYKMNKKIKSIKRKIDNIKLGNSFTKLFYEIENEVSDYNSEFISIIMANLKLLLRHNFVLNDVQKMIAIINSMENTKKDFENSFEKYFLFLLNQVNPLFIENYILNDKLIRLIKENKDISKKRTLSKLEKKEFKFIIEFVENEIGANRLNIDKRNLSISVDDEDLSSKEIMQNLSKLSTGEKNFIAISFSLFSYLNRYRKNEFEVLCFDDPFSSYDSNFKFQIFHLICHFCTEKNMPIFIFTHSTDYFILSRDSIKITKNFYILNTNKTFSDDINLVNQEMIGINKIDPDELTFLSLSDLIKWFKNTIHENRSVYEFSILIITFFPIMRSICTMLNHNEWKDLISKMIHCNDFDKELNNSNFKNKLKNFFTTFFIDSKKDDDFWIKIVEELINNSKTKILEQKLEEYLDILASFFVNRKKDMRFHLCRILLYSIFFRKKIPFYLIKNNENYIEQYSKRQITIRELINNTNKINDESKIFLNNIRILSDDIIHQENNFNIICLALEITPKKLFFYVDRINKIMKECINDKK